MSNTKTTPLTITQDELDDLVLKLQALLPDYGPMTTATERVSALEILRGTCSYIQTLHREVDGLSERLCQLLASMGRNGTVNTEIVRRFLERY